jgi:phage shock protein A
MGDIMTTPLLNGNDNGKVTLAILAQKIDRLAEDLREFKAELKAQDRCIDELERATGKLETRVTNNEMRINSWSLANSVGVVIAGLLAAVGLGSK